MIVPGILVCSTFLISVCMFIVPNALLITSATVLVRAGVAIRLNPFATVLFTVCSAVTVECCVLYPCCVGVCMLCVALLIDLFVLCDVKQFAMCLGVVVILLLNVMEVLVWVEVFCWIDRVWSSR